MKDLKLSERDKALAGASLFALDFMRDQIQFWSSNKIPKDYDTSDILPKLISTEKELVDVLTQRGIIRND